MDVSGQRDITGGPTERDGNETGGDLPSSGDVSLGSGDKGHDPDQVQGDGVESQERDGGGDVIGQEQDREGSEEFTKVGSSGDDLRPGRGTEDLLGEDGTETVFEVSVTVQGGTGGVERLATVFACVSARPETHL